MDNGQSLYIYPLLIVLMFDSLSRALLDFIIMRHVLHLLAILFISLSSYYRMMMMMMMMMKPLSFHSWQHCLYSSLV